MTFDYFRCECGRAHLNGARYCERCGAQPPKRARTGRQEPTAFDEAGAAEFVAACLELNRALETTGGKWGVA